MLTEITYITKYPEERNRDTPERWSVRQTGVYHRFDTRTQKSFWILLHPKPDSPIRLRVEDVIRAVPQFNDTDQNMMMLHLSILGKPFGNWRWYMAHFEEEIEDMVSSAYNQRKSARLSFASAKLSQCCTARSTVIEEEDELRISHQELSKLRSIERKLQRVAPLTANFNETLLCVKMFHAIVLENTPGAAIPELISEYQDRARAYDQYAHFLLQRVAGTSKAISDALGLKHQKTAHKTSQSTLALTNVAVRDSATIRVITFVTLLYLPSTFVAVS